MKKRFLLISMFAAAMLATSCSKDDNGVIQTVEPQPVTIQVQKTYPITVKATKKSSVSKISLGSDGYSELFDKDDKLVLTWGSDGSVELPLTNGDGTTSATFSGEIPVTAEGQVITAHIGSPIDATTQLDYNSLEDAVKNVCYLVSQKSFTYTAGADIPQITLDDQNSYLHFKLASTQLKFDLNIDGTDHTFSSFDANNEVWIVVPGGKTIKGNMISVSGKSLNAAKVYTVDRTDVVDLGLSVLWATCNLGATDPGTYGTKYLWGQTPTYNTYYKGNEVSLPVERDAACEILGADKGWRMPTKAELDELAKVGKDFSTQNGGNTFKNDYGSVFFPIEGDYGFYWASNTGENSIMDGGYYLFISSAYGNYTVLRGNNSRSQWSYPIRPVRVLN